jgi:hypothetical protein
LLDVLHMETIQTFLCICICAFARTCPRSSLDVKQKAKTPSHVADSFTSVRFALCMVHICRVAQIHHSSWSSIQLLDGFPTTGRLSLTAAAATATAALGGLKARVVHRIIPLLDFPPVASSHEQCTRRYHLQIPHRHQILRRPCLPTLYH